MLNGQKWALGDNRVLGARFEKYLNEPEDSSAEAIAYRKQIKQLLDLLSPRQIPPNVLSKAVGMLTKASAYPGDAQLCDMLTQVLYTAQLAKYGRDAKKEAIVELEGEQKRLIREMGMMYDEIVLVGPNSNGGKGAGGNKKGPGGDGRITNPKYLQMGKRMAEIEVLKKKYEGENAVSLVEAKIHYQAALAQLFMQRRFEHVVIGARLYNHVFNDGNSRLNIKKGSDADKLFSDSLGMPPTVATLDALSSEAIRDSDRHIEAVKYLLEKGELVAASKRLSEAFLVGEFLPPITTFPRAEKRKVQEFLRSSYRLISAIEAKDYTGAQELVVQLKKEARDFDAVKAETGIAAYTRASDMHLFSAKQALMEGDKAKADAEIRLAIEIWPRNPKLNELDQALVQTNEVIIAKNDFKRFLAEENYRQIFREQYRFAPVVAGDPEMQDALQQIVGNIAKIDAAVMTAKQYESNGQTFAAWEMLKSLRDEKAFSQDPILGRQIEELVPQVSELTVALHKASKLEEEQEAGSALAWYI